jgi:hypothetical protein
MSFDAHERARFLIDESRVAGVPVEEAAWLRGHLAQCAECAREAETTERLLGAMGEMSFAPVQTPRVVLASAGHKRRWTVPLAIAAAMLVAAVPLYRSAREARRDEADAQLLERVGSHVSRNVPQALEPLMYPEQESTR